jgi:hypothetical protein
MYDGTPRIRTERDTYFYYDDDADNNIGEELERRRRRKGKFLAFAAFLLGGFFSLCLHDL